MVTVAVDVMGGDHGPSVTLPAAEQALKKLPDLVVILVGDRGQLPSHLRSHPRVVIVHTTDVVAMDADPVHAMRKQKQSSMRLALDALADGRAMACVSAGNTGALMGMAKFVLKMYPTIERPAIMAVFPSETPGASLYMLDLGANVSATADQLHQFAHMGRVAVTHLTEIRNPRVALLNIGHEAMKGNTLVQQAGALLEADPALNYVGYLEANALYANVCDVLVCDGFVGNSVLKAIEGTVKTMQHAIKQSLYGSWFKKMIGLAMRWVLRPVRQQFDPDRYNGALLLGLRGAVIKSHGNASVRGFEQALTVAYRAAKEDIVAKIGEDLTP
jgi:glycerol-3-phosphate acyltransferase PlsX